MTKESSFFEKLKKGMGTEEPVEERMGEVEKKPRVKKPKKLEIKAEPIEPEVEKNEEPEVEKEKPSSAKTVKGKEKWFESEGQLAIDVYQTENELIIQSAIAGVKPENLDISIENDVITIRGGREKPFEEEGNYFAQECYWGLFSREIILPVEVDPGRVEATIKEGILTIRIPKILREGKKKISVKG